MYDPLESHWSMVKCMLRYFNNTSTHGFLLEPTTSMHKISLRAYDDSDWVSGLVDMRLNLGSCMFLGPNLVAWSYKKKSLVVGSSMKAEYRALAHTTSKVSWIGSHLQKLSISYLPLSLICDNLSVFMLSHNLIMHARTQHI